MPRISKRHKLGSNPWLRVFIYEIMLRWYAFISQCVFLLCVKRTHQLPFSNVFIPVHVILYHLLDTKIWTLLIKELEKANQIKVLYSMLYVHTYTHTHLIFLGNKVVYDEHLEPELSAQLSNVLQKVFNFSVILLLQISHLTEKTHSSIATHSALLPQLNNRYVQDF